MKRRHVKLMAMVLAAMSVSSVIGAETVKQSRQNIMIGDSIASKASRVDGKGLIVVGDTNSVGELAKKYSYKNAVIMGHANQVNSLQKGNIDGLLVLGGENAVSFDKDTTPVGPMVLLGVANRAVATEGNELGLQESVLVGIQNKSLGKMAAALGNGNAVSRFGVGIGANNKAGYASIAIGYYNDIDSEVAPERSIPKQNAAGSIGIGNHTTIAGTQGIGIGNNVSIEKSGNQSIAIGLQAKISIKEEEAMEGLTKTNVEAAMAQDSKNKAPGIGHAIAIGEGARQASSMGIVMGYQSSSIGYGAVVIGSNTSNSIPDAVVLGNYSSGVDKAYSLKKYGYNFKSKGEYKDSDQASYAASIPGVVSVGNESRGYYRRITGVAAGLKDTDVVNVGQLKDAMQSVSAPADAVTKESLKEALKDYVKTSALPAAPDLSGFATKTELSSLATKDEIKDLATKSEIAGLGTPVDVSGLATKEELTQATKGLASKADIQNMATKDDIKGMAMKEDIKDMATKTDIKASADALHEKVTKERKDDLDALKASLGEVAGNNAGTQEAIAGLQQDVSNLRSDMNAGVANAAALAAMHMQPMENGQRAQIMMGLGFHGGKQSIALGAGYRINQNVVMNAGMAMGEGGKYTGNLGVSWRFGQATPVAAPDTIQELQQEVQELKELVRLQAQQIQQLMQQR